MEHVAARSAQEQVSGCPFCAIITGAAPARLVHETDETLAFFPDVPAVRGHTLVVPKTHVSDFLLADDQTSAAVASATTVVGRALDALLRPEGMNTITSAREAATQSVMHLHVHVLPRWRGDAMGDLWPEDRATSPQELDELAESLRQSFGSSAG